MKDKYALNHLFREIGFAAYLCVLRRLKHTFVPGSTERALYSDMLQSAIKHGRR